MKLATRLSIAITSNSPHFQPGPRSVGDELVTKQVFGQPRKPAKMLRAGLYARVSTLDQETLPLQMRALQEYAANRGRTVAMQVREVGSGAVAREQRQQLIEAARRCEIDGSMWF